MLHWEAGKVQATREHEGQVREALEAHREEVQRLQRLWEVARQQCEALNRGTLAAALEAHAAANAAMDERNLQRHKEYQVGLGYRGYHCCSLGYWGVPGGVGVSCVPLYQLALLFTSVASGC
jgi:ferric-dicitrate binding protein FerR (iron transport regulator)